MPAWRTGFLVILLSSWLGLANTAYATTPQRHTKARVAAKTAQVDPTPAAPPAPPVPLTPAQMPATPPQVTYDNGTLTIVAKNSTLGDILRAVHAQTGAVMDISGNASERVASQFGPGSPRAVLAELLNGSSYNYVILGSPNDPGMVQKLVLTPKSGGDAEPQTAEVAAGGPPARIQPPAQPAPEATEDEAEDDSDAQEEQPATPAEAAQQPAQPPAQPQIKTPEQLLQELQRQQQLLQQQGQQGQQQNGGEAQPQGSPRQQ